MRVSAWLLSQPAVGKVRRVERERGREHGSRMVGKATKDQVHAHREPALSAVSTMPCELIPNLISPMITTVVQVPAPPMVRKALSRLLLAAIMAL
jgi:hypothetical protein